MRFSVSGGTKEIAGLWFPRGISTQADTMTNIMHVFLKCLRFKGPYAPSTLAFTESKFWMIEEKVTLAGVFAFKAA